MRTLYVLAAVGVLVLAAAGWAGWRFWRNPTGTMGGVMLVYEVDLAHPLDPALPREQVMPRTLQAVRHRLWKLAPLARVEASGSRLVVRAPVGFGSISPAMLKRTLPRPAVLELKPVDDESAFHAELVRRVRAQGVPGIEAAVGVYGPDRRPDPHLVAESEEELAAAVAKLLQESPVPGDRQLALERLDTDGKYRWRTHALYRKAGVTNEDIRDAELSFDEVGRPEVAVSFSPTGAKRLESLTERSIGRRLAILLDGRVISAPLVTSRFSERAVISMGTASTLDARFEANDLAALLRVGALAAPIVLVDEQRIGSPR